MPKSPRKLTSSVNPDLVILSGEMMLRYLGWGAAADLIVRGMAQSQPRRLSTILRG